ncbi:hypothetical protein R77560_04110 [Ralstonia thomasii]|uniref:Uncharacterized protein n=5 Tax=Pseudomonadota TaxID=1224 RepID=A0AAD2BTY7_9RALS|nr:hypothetical protein R77560_04110 [Ralstonia sp. LMG 18095]
MILMVHNNGGSPKWWAKEGKFGRGSAMWGPIEYMHLGKTEGETSATWLDKQKTGYDVVVDGIPASTLMLLSGSYSSASNEAIAGVADVLISCERSSGGVAMSSLARVAKHVAEQCLDSHPHLRAMWDAKMDANGAPVDAVLVEPPVSVAEMLQDLGKHLREPVATEAAPSPWEF